MAPSINYEAKCLPRLCKQSYKLHPFCALLVFSLLSINFACIRRPVAEKMLFQSSGPVTILSNSSNLPTTAWLISMRSLKDGCEPKLAVLTFNGGSVDSSEYPRNLIINEIIVHLDNADKFHGRAFFLSGSKLIPLSCTAREACAYFGVGGDTLLLSSKAKVEKVLIECAKYN